jgi:hypothetical protein
VARDIEADAKINDKSGPGLKKFEENVRRTGKNVDKEFDRFGKSAGDSILKGIGAVSPKLAKSLAKGIGDSASLGAPLLISGLGAALPVLSGLIGSAVTGGAAGAGIIGGVALAARDPRVKDAGTTLASNLLATLSTDAESFIGPVLNSIDKIGQKFTQLRPLITSIFEGSSKFLEPLIDSALDFSESLLQGIDIAVGRAGPVMEALGNGIELLGSSIEGFFDNLSANAEGNAVVLDQAFKSVAGTITLLGQVLGGVTYIFEQFNAIMPLSLLGQLNDAFNDTADSGRRTQGGTFGAAEGVRRVGDAAATTEADMKLYNKALEDNARAAQASADANAALFSDATRVGEATDAASAAAKRNGKTLSENTAKGRANRDALSNLASAMNGYRANLEKSGASTSTVNNTMNTQRSRLVAVANSMGITGQKARDLANRLLGIPTKRDTKVNVNTAAASAAARNIREEIAQVKGKTVSITILTPGLTRAREAVNLRRELLLLNSGSGGSWHGFAGGEGSGRRVGGALSVTSNVAVNLDGRAFRDYTTQQIASDRNRTAFRNRVGRRDGGGR